MQSNKQFENEQEQPCLYGIDCQHAGKDINQAGRDINVIQNFPIKPSLDLRIAHTLNLRSAIHAWLDNFPLPPGSIKSTLFFSKVQECERHPLYADLTNHLIQSGFDIFTKWELYKNNVKYFDEIKDNLLAFLEKSISDIFPSLELRFVYFYNPFKYYEFEPPKLSDLECCLPNLIFESLLFPLDIDHKKYENAKTQSEAEELHNEIMFYYDIWNQIEEHVQQLEIINKENSVVWGNDNNIELIRMPKQDIDILQRGKDEAIRLFVNGSDSIKQNVKTIFDHHRILEHEREELIIELEKSLYCEIFLGDCRYLGNLSPVK